MQFGRLEMPFGKEKHGLPLKKSFTWFISIPMICRSTAMVDNGVVVSRQTRWKAPLRGIYKLNIDVAIHLASSTMGAGIVTRDNQGFFMADKTQSQSGCLDPYHAELLAAIDGLLFAWELSFRRVILEGDAQLVYSSIKDLREDHSYNSTILQDIWLYASWFDFCECNYIRRLCNKVNDELAHLGYLGIDNIWVDDPPEEICYL